MIWMPTVIFVISYALIASRRVALLPIGRSAGAMLGAVLMLVCGVLSPSQAYAAIDGNTIVLLFGMMALSTYLERAGLFELLSSLALRYAERPLPLLFGLVFVAGGLSAFLLNDAVCMFLAPVVIHVCKTRRLPMAPYLLALATSSNIGSAATLVGNPQNIIIASQSHYDFLHFMRVSGPASLVGLLVNGLLLLVYYRRELVHSDASPMPALVTKPLRERLPVVVGVGVVVGYLCGFDLTTTTLAGVTVLVVADRREPDELWKRIDWALLVFFIGLFVVVEGFAQTGFPAQAWALLSDRMRLDTQAGVATFSAFTLVGSNLFSNVPMVLLTGPSLSLLGSTDRGFALLAFVSTVAGNLTLLGSVANLIVAEKAKEHYILGFFEYLRFGLVSTALVLAIGIPLVCLMT